ncbi:ciliary microtubule-associated protein 2-like [Ptychodera flava]|uniref:ciliary microtubule-associated protein 2-like n=1 Tax=Ptychodera flava TaxID=63121 RepID=UPI00396A105F
MSAKKFSGAPFGTQKSRFDTSGVHPASKMPGTFTEVPYCTKSMDELNRRRGPGMYDVLVGGFSKSAVLERSSGPGWARAYEVARMAALPHLLYKDQWEKKRAQQRNLGPGSYNIKDFMQSADEKPRSTRGICETRDRRFRSVAVSGVPGPGTYGKGGIPHSAIEEKATKSMSNVGMLDAGSSTPRNLPTVGCELGPGTYQKKSFTDEVTSKVTSVRGPYDLFTGDRNAPIKTGHLAVPNLPNLGPGQYNLDTFLDKWQDEHWLKHGELGKVEQYPTRPSERMYCSTLSQWPKKQSEPGPGSYNAKDISRIEAHNPPPFISSADRFDKRARKFFTGSSNPVGAGRYDINSWEEAQHKNGHSSVFNSKVMRVPTVRDNMLQERINPKNVRPMEKVFVPTPQNQEDYIRARRVVYAQ